MTVPISLMAVLTAFASLLAQPLSENPKDDAETDAAAQEDAQADEGTSDAQQVDESQEPAPVQPEE